MNLFAITSLSCGISCVILAIFSYAYGKRKIHRLLLGFNIAVAFWGFGLFFSGITGTPKESLFGWQVGHLGGFFIGTFFYHLICEFCEIKRKKILIFAYFQAIFFNLLSFGTDKVFTKTRFIFGFHYNEVTPLLFLGIVAYVTLIALSYLELIRFLKAATGYKRTQAIYIMFSFLCGFIGGTSTFLPEFRIDYLYPVGNLGITVYCGVLTYAIFKHKLLNIKVAFTRGAILLMVYACIVAFPALFATVGREWLKGYLGVRWFYLPLGIYSILALLAPYIYLHFQNQAEQKRIQRQIHLHQSLKAASQTTIEVQSIDRLSKIIPRYLMRLYARMDNKISQISLFLKEKGTSQYVLKS
ncbi:MAG: histidine kinase N-terminal 7TM domain-containing protein, partial [Patescibacteria group bacterium]